MQGKTVLITGSTSGLGKETAIQLAKKGGEIILTGRSEKKGQRAVEEIINKTGNSNIRFFPVNHSLQSETRKFAAELKAQFPVLDLLINNVGTAGTVERIETEEGFEYILSMNHLNPLLLTELLIPSLQKSKDARIINISTPLHLLGEVDLENSNNRNDYQWLKATANSKLLSLISFRWLATVQKAKGMMVTNADSGLSFTEPLFQASLKVVSWAPQLAPFLFLLDRAFPVENGAKIPASIATISNPEKLHGKYIGKDLKHLVSHRLSYNAAIQEKVYNWSLKMTGLKN